MLLNVERFETLECDILVAGGGAAGVPCALSAARLGAKVILVQDRPVLGGNASSEVRMHIVGANGTGAFDRGEELVTEAREGGIVEEIRLDNCVNNPQRSASVFDLILYDKCRNEPNLRLLLNTAVVGVEMTGQNIQSAYALRNSTEQGFRVYAKIFIDCTGDGRLGFETGAPFMEGRESQERFGETLAPTIGDNYRLGSTILLQARKHPVPMPFSAPAWARRFSRDELRYRLYATPGHEQPTHEYGYWWAEWGGTLDTIKDNEAIRDELLSIALGIWDHVKNGPPGTEQGGDPFQATHWALEWIGFLPGKRESRRFVGQHVLTEQDVLQSTEFGDAIAFGGWSLDLHPPQGIDATGEQPCEQHPVPWLYDIPLRSCISRDIRNLMFAGRNMSATHVAFSSTRVMATCAAVGQGVGTAAALAVARATLPGNIVLDARLVYEIQQQLLRDDLFLINRQNEDANDLARSATILASSSQPLGSESNVISSQTRAVHGLRGAPPHRARPGTHRWMSDPQLGFPAWIEFLWPETVCIVLVQLAFDTGQHRHLTLSHHDGYTSRMQWGRPQVETVASYRIEFEQEGAWKLLADVSGNYQRLRRHVANPSVVTSTRRLRITVIATHGIDHARIMEVRINGRRPG